MQVNPTNDEHVFDADPTNVEKKKRGLLHFAFGYYCLD